MLLAPDAGGWDRRVRRAPPGVSDHSRLFRRDVAVPRTTLSGLTGLSERFGRRSGDMGSPRPPRSFSRPRGVPPSDLPDGPKTARQLPQASSPSQGSGHRALPGHAWPGRPSWGFPPLQRHRRRDRASRVCLTRNRPSSRFLTASTVSSLSSLADSLGPLPLLGFFAREALSGGEAGTSRDVRCALSSTVLHNLEL